MKVVIASNAAPKGERNLIAVPAFSLGACSK
jgi:hypothetical protein